MCRITKNYLLLMLAIYFSGIDTCDHCFPGSDTTIYVLDALGYVEDLGAKYTKTSANVSCDQVKFYQCYEQSFNNGKQCHKLIAGNKLSFSNAGFKCDANFTVLLIHGYIKSVEDPVFNTLTAAYHDIHPDYNIILVDYPACCTITEAISILKGVGRCVSNLLDYMSDYCESAPKIHLVGPSYGAQISGYASRMSKKRVTKITGLDPVTEFYENTAEILNPRDADFVQIIHTNAGLFGVSNPIGHADYYFNAVTAQPDCCGAELLAVCNHYISQVYYAACMYAEKKGTPCLAARCSCNSNAKCGDCSTSEFQDVITGTLSGQFCIQTSENFSYAFGTEARCFNGEFLCRGQVAANAVRPVWQIGNPTLSALATK